MRERIPDSYEIRRIEYISEMIDIFLKDLGEVLEEKPYLFDTSITDKLFPYGIEDFRKMLKRAVECGI